MVKDLPKVETANALDDETYRSHYVPDLSRKSDGVTFEFASAASLVRHEQEVGRQTSDLEACFQLLKSTSSDDYQAASVGWNTSSKRKEMRLPDMRYILVRDQTNSIQGFASFMITYEDGYETVYIYEVHLYESLRGKGIGAKLVGVAEEVGRRAKMEKAMLTVFVRNEAAYQFYQHLGYTTDDCSPQPRKLRNGVVKEPDYRILSKALNIEEASPST